VADGSLGRKQDQVHHQWIQSHAVSLDQSKSAENADWAEAWFALDSLMHHACHVSVTVYLLRNNLPAGTPTRESQIIESRDGLVDAHRQWRERPVVRRADDAERLAEVLKIQELHINDSPAANLNEGSFLGYEPLRISDFFLASRLHTWRAIQLYISLIDEPRWGMYDSSRVVCAVELCRIHAALGIERNFLGAEKACGLYLAGITWGGPDMYSVSISVSGANF
jgi:hypothetical protein